MSSHSSKFLLVPALAMILFAGTRPAAAAVTQVGGASFEVSAQVVASCDIETGASAAAKISVSCDGAKPALEDSAMSDLTRPTDDEAAAPAGSSAVTVVY